MSAMASLSATSPESLEYRCQHEGISREKIIQHLPVRRATTTPIDCIKFSYFFFDRFSRERNDVHLCAIRHESLLSLRQESTTQP